MSTEPNREELIVSDVSRGTRLDRWLVDQCPQLSRARLQELIVQGQVLLNGAVAKASHKLRGGEQIVISVRPRPPLRAEPETIPLIVMHEDEDLLIVDKPAGMSVHAGAGSSRGTLVNALLGRGQSLSRGGSRADDLRPGIVHRLDKQTSGLVVVAKNDYSHAKLAEAFRTRAVKKTYLALVEGEFHASFGKIELPIGRDPVRRTRMKAFAPQSSVRGRATTRAREARTEWRKLAGFGAATLLEVQLHTGRTHQIRVHFSAVQHPLVGDSLYGAAAKLIFGKTELSAIHRQFLHAARLAFPHPRTGEWIESSALLPADLRAYLDTVSAVSGCGLEAVAEYL
jgi:23S rRNA pseudouridine1911/1915/1917 synthase